MQQAKGCVVNICFAEMIMLQMRNVSVTDKTQKKIENHHASAKFVIFFNAEFNSVHFG